MKQLSLNEIVWALVPSGNMPPRDAESNTRTKRVKERKRRQLARLLELERQHNGANMKNYLAILGHKVKDKITGFSGVCSSVHFDLYGCVQCVVDPENKENDPKTGGRFFDFKRLDITSDQPVMPQPAFATMTPGLENGPADKPGVP